MASCAHHYQKIRNNITWFVVIFIEKENVKSACKFKRENGKMATKHRVKYNRFCNKFFQILFPYLTCSLTLNFIYIYLLSSL